MTFGSLFAGIGGLDLGLERAGMECRWQVEKNRYSSAVLERHWPNVKRHEDVTKTSATELEPVDLICGGDPCPKHSRARSNGASKHPDLSGYFLSLVGGLRPEWVVRENVPAPTVRHFCAALDKLGYGSVIVRCESSPLTGQLRQRDYVIGRNKNSWPSPAELFSDCGDGPGSYTTRLGERQVAPALTTHRTRYDSRDCYIWEPGDGLRILDAEEREALAGFPRGWTAGFSEATRARMCGNAVVPQVAEWLGRRLYDPHQSAIPL